ncbi:uncharacterized protein K441DRAFT_660281 [Cenococcum geophilum 1.58]|uniref:uncharacterized protein n=1 Tax=Cenococcum geophilum 1.58 TaxID=794803 RepID=UPI00358E2F5A|nr:hypothetical protein K441DRAFT_660281 [Cenococcum geophilum 1.58]
MAENRFSPITTYDHAGLLWITAILCLIYSFIAFMVRGHVKWNLYGVDDAFLAAATVAHLAQTIAVFIGLNQGLGKSASLDAPDHTKSGEATFAGVTLFIIAVWLAKFAVLSLMIRIFVRDIPAQKILTTAIYSLFAAAGLASVLGFSVQCSASSYLDSSASYLCKSQMPRWRLITILDVGSEIILMLIPTAMVYPLQMAFNLKFQVVLAFAFRLPLIALSILHLHYIPPILHHSLPNSTSFVVIPALLIQQVQLCWSLLSATIPNLRSFMKSFHSGFGMDMGVGTLGTSYTPRSYGNGSRGRAMGIRLNSLTTQDEQTPPQGSRTKAGFEHSLRPDAVERSTVISHNGKGDVKLEDLSLRSGGSQELIIRRDIEWSVSY